MDKNRFLCYTNDVNLVKDFLKQITDESGQVIVEYVLLLAVSVVMALLLIQLVTVDPSKNSPVFRYWKNLLEAIGRDQST